MENFKERRENILGIFNQAKSELEALNKDIDLKIEDNTKKIADLQNDNVELLNLKMSNESSAKAFAKFFR